MERLAAINEIREFFLSHDDLRDYVQFETHYFEHSVESKESFFEQAGHLLLAWRLECFPKRSVELANAEMIVKSILGISLAYREPLLKKDQCDELSRLIFSLLSQPACYLTNAQFNDDFRLRGWNPCTKHTMDTGIIGFDHDFAFMVWARDDD